MSTLTAPRSEADRRRMIADRQKTSVFWKVVHLLGSLQLALILLATIAIACAIATFYESGFNAKIAQAYIYKAPWFLFWLGVLCVNLFAVTITRWPWQKKHTGFIITHYGIITLLIGAVIGSQAGFEGNVTLSRDAPPLNRITTSRSIIQIESPVDSSLYVMPFDASVVRPRESKPTIFPVPGTNWKVVANDFTPHLVEEKHLEAAADGKPGLRLLFTSATAGQPHEAVLLLDGENQSSDLFGMAAIEFMEKLPERELVARTESQMVFARFGQIVDGQANSGVVLELSEDGKRLTVRPPDAAGATYQIKDMIGRPVQAGSASVLVLETWSDLEMVEGKPVNRSPDPNNPAALVQVTYERAGQQNVSGLKLELAPGEEGTVVYELLRDGMVSAQGTASKGDRLATGWNDWEFSMEDVQAAARPVTRLRPAEENPSAEEVSIPGFLARLEVPGEPPGPATWVRSGDITTLPLDHRYLRMGYGLELRPVPFSIRLLNFEVPRYEGTQQPSNFIATVEFRDPATGERKEGTAQMNSPASWPGGIWAHLTGLNYKFSQAEWNPRDLNETTLQVLYDPGWLFKWFGSLAICTGIGIMFYWKSGGEKRDRN